MILRMSDKTPGLRGCRGIDTWANFLGITMNLSMILDEKEF